MTMYPSYAFTNRPFNKKSVYCKQIDVNLIQLKRKMFCINVNNIETNSKKIPHCAPVKALKKTPVDGLNAIKCLFQHK